MLPKFLSSLNSIVKAHSVSRQLNESVWTPDHPQRGAESNEFQESKQALEKESPGCFICGVTELPAGQHFEGHHFQFEWSLANSIDLAKVQKDWPNARSVADFMDSVDNLLILCPKCHRAPKYGVHMISMPAWIVQKYQKDGWDLVSGDNAAGVFDREDMTDYYPEH